MLAKKTVCLAGAVLATAQLAFADVDWTASPVVINEGTKAEPVVVEGETAYAIGNLEVSASGALKLKDSASVTMSAGPQKINGYLELNDTSALTSSTKLLETSKGAGTSSEVVLNGGTLAASGFVFGADGDSNFTINGGAIRLIGNTDLKFAGTNANVTMTANGGTVENAYHIYWGPSGKCVAYLNEGFTPTITKYWSIAENTGSKAEVYVNGCIWTSGGSQGSRLGYYGEGLLHVRNGEAAASGIAMGYGEAAKGTLIIEEGGTVKIGNNSVITVGDSGQGEVILRGGTVKPASSAAMMTVRANDSAKGVVRGWGLWDAGTTKSATVNNNGFVIADGKDEAGVVEERTLKVITQFFNNTIDNTSSNGWYAVNKAMLEISDTTVMEKSTALQTFTFGESNDEKPLDLINTARLTFYNNSAASKLYPLHYRFYALDRSDAHIDELTVPAGKSLAAVFEIVPDSRGGGAYESADLEFRYDHTIGPRADSLWGYDTAANAWVKIDQATPESGYRICATGLSKAQVYSFFAVLVKPASSGMVVIVR